MLEIVFIDTKTGRVNYAITDVSRIRYITPSEIGFEKDGSKRGCSFPVSEKLEVKRVAA